MTLATIRTRKDLDEAISLCSPTGTLEDCWVGLFQSGCEYEFMDGSILNEDDPNWNLGLPQRYDMINLNVQIDECFDMNPCMVLEAYYGSLGIIEHRVCDEPAIFICDAPGNSLFMFNLHKITILTHD